MGVNDGAVRRPLLSLSQQAAQFRSVRLEVGACFIKNLRHTRGNPAAPPGQHTALIGCRCPVLVLKLAQHRQGSHIRLETRTGTRRG